MRKKTMRVKDAIAFAIPLLLLAVAVILSYMNSLSGPFIFDDLRCITANMYIRKLWPLTDVLLKAPPGCASDGRPIVSLSLAINYAIGGLHVFGYHLFNIAAHFAAVLVLWGVLRRTLQYTRLNVQFGPSATFLAFASALIWAVHPLNTESVTYTSTRTELLMGLFYLLTLYCSILAWQSNHPRIWSVLAVVSCALGMGSKEAMVSAPLMVLLYDAMLVSSSLRDALRRHMKLYIGLAATWGLLVWLNLSGPRSLSCGLGLGISSLDYLRTQADVIVWYLRLCFWPHPLVISYHGWPLVKSFTAILPQGLFIMTLLVLTACAFWRRHPAALLGAWFFMILGPTSSFIPIVTEIVAERRMYLPSVAVIIAVVLSIFAMNRWINRHLLIPIRETVVAPVVLTLIAIALGITTFIRNRDYQSAIAIWTDTIAQRPDNIQALANLGYILSDAGEHERAITLFTRAVELQPDKAGVYINRGNAYDSMGNYDLALQDYNKSIALEPENAQGYYNRGISYGQVNEYDKAIHDFTQAIELKPEFADAYNMRAVMQNDIGHFNQSAQDSSRVIELNPDHAIAYNNRAISYYRLKEYDKAWADIEKCQQLGGHVHPEFIKALAQISSQPG